MNIFLSYASEDAEAARLIYDRLLADNHTVFNWRAGNEGERFIDATERAIREADYFFALVSPSFLASNWCREERNYALRCEHDLNGDRQFIHVLQISKVNPRDAGYIGNYGWLDVTTWEAVGPVLDGLVQRLNQNAQRPAAATAGGAEAAAIPAAVVTPDTRSTEVAFRNREDELEKVLRGLTNAAGPHFWLVLGPPQLGKTWFLDRVRKDQLLTEPPGWLIKRIDLREQALELRADADALLSLMFGRSPSPVNRETLREIAVEIIHSRQPHLYVLDSAELLDGRAAGQLREHLRPIYQWVLAGGLASSRLAVIVASRQDEGWRGLRPDPRLSDLSLSEFTVAVVQKALREMGAGRNIGEETYWHYAELAHSLTEGLPALLTRCLQWVVDQEWIDLDRMARTDTFRRVAGPYIESELLTSESLFPGDSIQSDGQLLALRHAYRLLAPYRLFTQSHLRHHLERDPDLTDILGRLDWSVTDLWQAIVGTALLTRPPAGLWQRIQPAVRRLLYRYFYESGGAAPDAGPGGIEAHREAARFIKVWAENQPGTEQVVGLVECLWHDANVLLSGNPADGAEELIESARHLSEDLRPSNAYTLEELREYAEMLMRADDEFQRFVSGVDGLFDRLVGIVCSP
jgi:hypothetical protein